MRKKKDQDFRKLLNKITLQTNIYILPVNNLIEWKMLLKMRLTKLCRNKIKMPKQPSAKFLEALNDRKKQ